MIGPAKIYFIVFGLLTIAGGVIGYAKAGSTASIIAARFLAFCCLSQPICSRHIWRWASRSPPLSRSLWPVASFRLFLRRATSCLRG